MQTCSSTETSSTAIDSTQKVNHTNSGQVILPYVPIPFHLGILTHHSTGILHQHLADIASDDNKAIIRRDASVKASWEEWAYVRSYTKLIAG